MKPIISADMGKDYSFAQSNGEGKLAEFTSKDAVKMIASGKLKIRRMISVISTLEKSVS